VNTVFRHLHPDLLGSHIEYQRFLFDHILDVLLRHWDVSVRELGSQSLRLICLRDMSTLAPLAIEKSVSKSLFGDPI
jgi:tubulin-specific chaperone D